MIPHEPIIEELYERALRRSHEEKKLVILNNYMVYLQKLKLTQEQIIMIQFCFHKSLMLIMQIND